MRVVAQRFVFCSETISGRNHSLLSFPGDLIVLAHLDDLKSCGVCDHKPSKVQYPYGDGPFALPNCSVLGIQDNRPTNRQPWCHYEHGHEGNDPTTLRFDPVVIMDLMVSACFRLVHWRVVRAVFFGMDDISIEPKCVETKTSA